MTKQIYTDTQIEELLKNKYVEKCSKKYITFSKDCKIEVLRLSKEQIFYRDIFKILWFPEYIVNWKVPERSYNRWRRNLTVWKIESVKWRKKKNKVDISKMTLEEQNEYLKTEVVFLSELHKQIYGHYP
jgi:hypothetical protein